MRKDCYVSNCSDVEKSFHINRCLFLQNNTKKMEVSEKEKLIIGRTCGLEQVENGKDGCLNKNHRLCR